jgi:hypothetical protein
MTRADKLVIAGLLLVVALLASSFWLLRRTPAADTLEVVVEVNGEVAEQFPLSDLEPGEQRQVMGPLGYSIVGGGKNMVRMVDSPCPDKICIGMGWIKYSGETVVCLPNRVVIRIVGADSLGLDGTSQ